MTLAEDIRAFLQPYAQGAAQKSLANSGYTGSNRLHYSAPLPEMREFLKTWVQQHDLDFEAWMAALDALYSGESLEERIFAGLIVARFSKFRRALPLAKLDGWLGQLEGWNEVDATCQSGFTAADLLADWAAWEAFLRALARDNNINKRRASLVLLILPVRESADGRILSLALENIDQLKGEKDKLISKAVSWLLREGIKQHREAINNYVEANKGVLPAFVVREVATKLETGKKQNHI